MKIQSILLFFLLSKAVFAQTILSGKVTDKATREDLIGASVRITKGDEVVKGAIADFDGKYRILLNPGIYSVGFSYTGHKSVVMDSIQVLKDQTNLLDVAMEIDTTHNLSRPMNYYIDGVHVQGNPPQSSALTSEQIKNLPTRSVQRVVADSTQTQHKPKKKARRSSRSKH